MKTLAAAMLVSLTCALATPALACPNCKEQLPSKNSSRQPGDGAPVAPLAEGFAWSIYLMMSMPYLLLGSFGAGVYFVYRKNTAARNQVR